MKTFFLINAGLRDRPNLRLRVYVCPALWNVEYLCIVGLVRQRRYEERVTSLGRNLEFSASTCGGELGCKGKRYETLLCCGGVIVSALRQQTIRHQQRHKGKDFPEHVSQIKVLQHYEQSGRCNDIRGATQGSLCRHG